MNILTDGYWQLPENFKPYISKKKLECWGRDSITLYDRFFEATVCLYIDSKTRDIEYYCLEIIQTVESETDTVINSVNIPKDYFDETLQNSHISQFTTFDPVEHIIDFKLKGQSFKFSFDKKMEGRGKLKLPTK